MKAGPVVIETLPPEHYARAALALGDPAINSWMYYEWRENAVTERTIAATAASKRNRLYLVRVGAEPYGVFALSAISTIDRTASVWYLRFPDAPRLPGAMTEALRLLVAEAFSTLDLNSLSASVHADNIASRLLLERAGFRRAGVLRDGFFRDTSFVDRVFYDVLKADRPSN
jgi:RimJ/RimL family protein N-acetyltransferase